MMDNYGSLRRRTRDASWQWLMMGAMLGLGVALVVCVAGYAFGAITFPALESDKTETVVAVADSGTETTTDQVVPNATEIAAIIATQVAAQMNATQQASEAQSGDGMDASGQPTEDMTPETPGAEQTDSALPLADSAPTPSPLPGNDVAPTATTTPAVAAADTTGQDTAANITAQDTPIVGTPPVGTATPGISLPSQPAVPPELDAIKTDMVVVTGGSFTMGTTPEEGDQAVDACALYNTECQLSWVEDAMPAHQVTVDTFELELFEVSLSQYVAFLNWMGPDSHKTGCLGGPCANTTQEEPITSLIEYDGETYSVRNSSFYANHPVTQVTWSGAEAYCNALNRRLPTEAEWERAARGPQNFIYPWGLDFDPALANSSRSGAEGGPEPVDSYPNGKSTYGAYNMAGNVAEWIHDYYQEDYYQQQLGTNAINPKGPLGGTQRVLRGGGFDNTPIFLRSVHRMSANPDQPTPSIGFRCAADSGNVVLPAAPAVNTNIAVDTNTETIPNSAPTLPPAATVALPTPIINPTPTGPLQAE